MLRLMCDHHVAMYTALLLCCVNPVWYTKVYQVPVALGKPTNYYDLIGQEEVSVSHRYL